VTRLLRALPALALLLLVLARPLVAQEQPAAPATPPLAGFTAMKVSITPMQLWHADTAGWSRSVEWPKVRVALDSAVQAVLEERGLAAKWTYASDMVRTARRNPTYAGDPYALGVARLRTAELKVGMAIPQLMADNLRPFTALNDTRYALIPVDLRAQGDGVVLRIVLVDTRSRTLTWGGELVAPGGAKMVEELAARIANLVIEP
jgi:hypothetical protein